MAVQAPTVLQKKSHRFVVKRIVGIADALDVGSWDSEAVGLQPRCPRNARAKEGQSPKIDVAAEVELEDLCLFGAQLNEVVVAANFECMGAADERQVVSKLETSLNAVHGGVRFSSEIREAGDVDAYIRTAWELRKAEVQPAPRHLRTEFVEGFVVDDRVVLESNIEIARLVVAGARTGVLPEYLVLRSGRKPGNERRRNTYANKRIVVIVPTLIKTRRPETCFLHHRIIPAHGIHAYIRSRKRHEARANSKRDSGSHRETHDVIYLHRQRAGNRDGKELGAECCGDSK